MSPTNGTMPLHRKNSLQLKWDRKSFQTKNVCFFFPLACTLALFSLTVLFCTQTAHHFQYYLKTNERRGAMCIYFDSNYLSFKSEWFRLNNATAVRRHSYPVAVAEPCTQYRKLKVSFFYSLCARVCSLFQFFEHPKQKKKRKKRKKKNVRIYIWI